MNIFTMLSSPQDHGAAFIHQALVHPVIRWINFDNKNVQVILLVSTFAASNANFIGDELQNVCDRKVS